MALVAALSTCSRGLTWNRFSFVSCVVFLFVVLRSAVCFSVQVLLVSKHGGVVEVFLKVEGCVEQTSAVPPSQPGLAV